MLLYSVLIDINQQSSDSYQFLEWGHSMSNQYSHVTHHLRVCSFLVHIDISMRYENSPDFGSISLLVPGLQHFEVGVFGSGHVFVAAIFTTPAHMDVSLSFDGVVQFVWSCGRRGK